MVMENEMAVVIGKGGISAIAIADSITESGIRLFSVETTAPKFLDAEIEKHRMISTNSSSSRAIPFFPLSVNSCEVYLPFDVRKNQRGMQGTESLSKEDTKSFQNVVVDLYKKTYETLSKFSGNIHKQHLNRYVDPWIYQKKIWTATEWDNFFLLRLPKKYWDERLFALANGIINHSSEKEDREKMTIDDLGGEHAQPEMQEVATCIKLAMNNSIPNMLYSNEWHLPYVNFRKDSAQVEKKEDLIKLSVARMARVSYKTHDKEDPIVEKDLKLYQQLKTNMHMTPFEGVARPMKDRVLSRFFSISDAENGVTHMDKKLRLWSGNFRGWIQYRQLLQKWN
jgi:thymidylate synthase ThyX